MLGISTRPGTRNWGRLLKLFRCKVLRVDTLPAPLAASGMASVGYQASPTPTTRAEDTWTQGWRRELLTAAKANLCQRKPSRKEEDAGNMFLPTLTRPHQCNPRALCFSEADGQHLRQPWGFLPYLHERLKQPPGAFQMEKTKKERSGVSKQDMLAGFPLNVFSPPGTKGASEQALFGGEAWATFQSAGMLRRVAHTAGHSQRRGLVLPRHKEEPKKGNPSQSPREPTSRINRLLMTGLPSGPGAWR